MDPDERLPIQTIREPGYELLIYWLETPGDPSDLNVDIEVHTGEAHYYVATVFTLRNVVRLLDRWRATGEHPNAYFRAPDAVIVDEPITETLIRQVVAEAVATGDISCWEQLQAE